MYDTNVGLKNCQHAFNTCLSIGICDGGLCDSIHSRRIHGSKHSSSVAMQGCNIIICTTTVTIQNLHLCSHNVLLWEQQLNQQ